jgi:hypothetical protein
MESIPTAAVFLVLVAAILVNFICLVYVSSVVHGDEGLFAVIMGISRSTRTFVRGWQQADELEIRPVMIAWTITIVVTLLVLCPVIIIYAPRGTP